MESVKNITPMSGGTSIPLGDAHAAEWFIVSCNKNNTWYSGSIPVHVKSEGCQFNFYYKIVGRNGDKFIISTGAYVDVTLQMPWDLYYGNEMTMPGYTWLEVTNPTFASIYTPDYLQKHSMSITSNYYYGIPGVLLDYEAISLPDDDYYKDYPNRKTFVATYRFWLLSGESTFLLDSAAKLFVEHTINSIGGSVRDIYLHFDNIPYVTYPAQINDIESFEIEYSFPNLPNVDYIQLALVDDADRPIVDYRDIPKNSNRYTFYFVEEDLAKLYAKYNTVNDASIYLGIKYKNKNNDTPVTISYPMRFSIVKQYPTVTVSISDNNKIINAQEVFVKSLSELKVVINPVAYKGASITYTSITYGGERYTNQSEATFEVTDVRQISVLCRDSRGNEISKTVVMDSWIPYMFPTCSISAEAPNTDGYLPVSVSGTYFDKYFSAFTNSFNIYYKYTSNNPDHSVTSWTQLLPRPTLTVDDFYHFTANFELLVPNHSDTYTVQIKFSDKYSSYESNSVTVKSLPVFDWSQDDFNFNVPVAIQGDLVVTGQIVNAQMAAAIEDSIPMDFIVEQGTVTTGSGNSTANWVYRKWNSGVAECWCRKHVSTAVNTAWGNLFVSGALSYTNITWGVNFVDIPVANITIAPNASGAFLIAGGSTSLTKTNTGGYEIARGSALASAGNFYINYYGIGKWK